MRRFPLALLQTAAVLVSASVLTVEIAAQESSDAMRGPDGHTSYHVAGIEVLPVAGKPFFAKDNIVWTRKLEDGSTVTTQLHAVVARDGQGRIYRERRSFVPANGTKEPKLEEIIVYDSAAHTRTSCVIATRQCLITSYRPAMTFRSRRAGPFADGTMTLAREDLGSNTIDDLSVIGTRETVTVDGGVVGNEKPLVTTREFWYSPALETNLSVVRNDPRLGTQSIHLADLSRAEPDAAIFEVPSGYTMHDLRRSSLHVTNSVH
jgi:hypothetical protein